MKREDVTVALLFADVEGSTELLKQLKRMAYSRLQDDFLRIFRRNVSEANGEEIDEHGGDSVFCSFPSARDAVIAAAAAQLELASHEWPERVEVRVRIGIHVGEVMRKGPKYIGLAVHRAARVSAAAHGGQTLLSGLAAEAVSDDLPDGLELRDLGPHPLKDLELPEHLFQLDVPGMPTEFPEPRAFAPSPRVAEIAGVRRLEPDRMLAEWIRRVAERQPEKQGLAEVLLGRHVDRISEDVVRLLDGERLDLPYARVATIVSMFYEGLEAPYFGVDSHPPDRFSRVHPFLFDHLANVYGRVRIVRMLPLSQKELKDALEGNAGAFADYVSWHEENAALLLRTSPQVAHDRARDSNLWTRDVGFWSGVGAMLFENAKTDHLRLHFVAASDDAFASCAGYVCALIDAASEIRLRDAHLSYRRVDGEMRDQLKRLVRGGD